MRHLVLSMLVLMSFKAMATEIIPYDQNRCVTIPGEKLFSWGSVEMSDGYSKTTVDVDGMMNFMTSFYSQIEESFVAARDPLYVYKIDPLCLAMYMEKGGVNAGAYGGDVIVFGMNLLMTLQKDWKIDGESGVKTILAHEYAHAIQAHHKVKFNIPLPLLATKMKEQQADCMAGVILTLHDPKAGSLPQSVALMEVLGSHHSVSSHGSSEERKRAFLRGLQEGVQLLMKKKNRLNTTSKDILRACAPV